jgi:transcriptional regulator with XRE-family HTH domain
MIIGDRLRTLREEKKLSQGDIEKRTGLIRCYVSRVENGHTVPAIETIEKFARALEVPMYQLFYDGDAPPQVPNSLKGKSDEGWGSSGKDGRYHTNFAVCWVGLRERPQVVAAHGAENGTSLAAQTTISRFSVRQHAEFVSI